MSAPFDPYKLRNSEVEAARPGGASDVLLTNPTALEELEAFWAALPRINGVPARRDIDPAIIGALLEDSFVLERVAPGVARCRVAGRNIGKLIGVEPRGMPLTAVFLPEARATLARHIEEVFTKPAIVELPLVAPRALGQPKLQGRILMLPLRDDHGRITRVLGMLSMSGRRGMGGRRFTTAPDGDARVDPILSGLSVVTQNDRPIKKAEDTPALRLVVSND